MNETSYNMLLLILKEFAFFASFALFFISLIVGLLLLLRPSFIIQLNDRVDVHAVSSIDRQQHKTIIFFLVFMIIIFLCQIHCFITCFFTDIAFNRRLITLPLYLRTTCSDFISETRAPFMLSPIVTATLLTIATRRSPENSISFTYHVGFFTTWLLTDFVCLNSGGLNGSSILTTEAFTV